MKRLIYRSTALQATSAEELLILMYRAREYNRSAGVTGMLFLQDCTFMQLLEGPPGEVDALFDRIRVDPRHTDLAVLLSGDIPCRMFPGWAMGFEHIEAEELASMVDGFVALTPVRSSGLASIIDGGSALEAFEQHRLRLTGLTQAKAVSQAKAV